MVSEEMKKKIQGIIDSTPLKNKKVVFLFDVNQTHIGFSIMGMDNDNKTTGVLYDTELNYIEKIPDNMTMGELARILAKSTIKTLTKKGYIV